jgi:hypothetical protein
VERCTVIIQYLFDHRFRFIHNWASVCVPKCQGNLLHLFIHLK